MQRRETISICITTVYWVHLSPVFTKQNTTTMSAELDTKSRAIRLIEQLDELLYMLQPTDGAPLTEERICQLCDDCLQTKVPQPLIRALGEAFTQPAILARCFQGKIGGGRSNGGGKTGTLLWKCLLNTHVLG